MKTLQEFKLENYIIEYTESTKKKLIQKFKSENEHLTDDQILRYINKFDQKRNSPAIKEKNIEKYNWNELEKLIDSMVSKNQMFSDNTVDSNELIYDDHGLKVYKGNSREKCIKYGDGYSWCISRKDSSNMFNSYRFRMDEPVFYFIRDTEKEKNDIHHHVVVYVTKKHEYVIANVSNSGDKPISWEELLEINPKIKFLKHLLIPEPLTKRERELYKKLEHEISDEKFLELSFDDKEFYISLGHPLSESVLKELLLTKHNKELLNKYINTNINVPYSIVELLTSSQKKKVYNNMISAIKENPELIDYYLDKQGYPVSEHFYQALIETKEVDTEFNLGVTGLLNSVKRNKLELNEEMSEKILEKKFGVVKQFLQADKKTTINIINKLLKKSKVDYYKFPLTENQFTDNVILIVDMELIEFYNKFYSIEADLDEIMESDEVSGELEQLEEFEDLSVSKKDTYMRKVIYRELEEEITEDFQNEIYYQGSDSSTLFSKHIFDKKGSRFQLFLSLGDSDSITEAFEWIMNPHDRYGTHRSKHKNCFDSIAYLISLDEIEM